MNEDLVYVTSYVNPDTDGVCSSLAYADFLSSQKHGRYQPVAFGRINAETKLVLEAFKMNLPISGFTMGANHPIILVDTHHARQLSNEVSLARVVEILDHHPAGDDGLFPNAKIRNEEVGAVATMIAEKYKESGVEPRRGIAGILAAAIISNTLNFSTPSTVQRDKEVFIWLSRYCNIDEKLVISMFETRSNISGRSTEEVVLSDYKEFVIQNKKIGIAQFESTKPSTLLTRSDLEKVMRKLLSSMTLDYFILNAVDIVRHESFIYTPDEKSKELAVRALSGSFTGSTATFSRILLRKTDLVPRLKFAIETS